MIAQEEKQTVINQIKKYECPPSSVKMFTHLEIDYIKETVLKQIKNYGGEDLEFKDTSLSPKELGPLIEFLTPRVCDYLGYSVSIASAYLFFSNKVPVTIHTDGGWRGKNKPVFKTVFIPLHITYTGEDYFTNDDYSTEKNVNTIAFAQKHYFERIFITYGCDNDVSDVKIPSDVCVSDKWWEVIQDSFDDFKIDEKLALQEFSDAFRGDLEQIKKHFRGFSVVDIFPNKKGHAIFFDTCQFHTSGSFINKNATEKFGFRLDLCID